MDFFASESKIEKQGESYKVTIRIPQNDVRLIFDATPINRSNEVSKFVPGQLVVCDGTNEKFSYAPLDDNIFLEAVKNNKAYGIIDSVNNGSGLSITILQRCHSNHVDVSVPIMFFSSNNGISKKENQKAMSHRQIVSISLDNRSVLSIRKINFPIKF